MNQIGDKIKTLRLERGLLGKDLANLIGKKKSYITMIEKNNRIPSLKTLHAIAKALNVPADDLIASVSTPRQIPIRLISLSDLELYGKGGLFYNPEFQLLTVDFNVTESASAAFTMDDDSMSPEFATGDIVVIDLRSMSCTDPEKGVRGLDPAIKSDHYVLCRPDRERPSYSEEYRSRPKIAVRKIVFDTNDATQITLIALNPSFRDIALKVQRTCYDDNNLDVLTIVGKVIGKFKRYE